MSLPTFNTVVANTATELYRTDVKSEAVAAVRVSNPTRSVCSFSVVLGEVNGASSEFAYEHVNPGKVFVTDKATLGVNNHLTITASQAVNVIVEGIEESAL